MTLNEFVAKYSGKKVDWDGQFQGQCVDLYRQYVKEVLNFPQSPPVVGAADIFNTASSDFYEKIKNTPDNIPKNGDVIIWNKKAGGGFGHVGVFVSGDVNEFTSFDRNWKQISVCEIIHHDYSNVIGWLRPKTPVTIHGKMYTEEEYTKVRLERDANWSLFQKSVEEGKTVIEKISMALLCGNSLEAILARVESVNKLEGQIEDVRLEAKRAKELHGQEKAAFLRRIEELEAILLKQQTEHEKQLEQMKIIHQEENAKFSLQLGVLKNQVQASQKNEVFLDKILKFFRL